MIRITCNDNFKPTVRRFGQGALGEPMAVSMRGAIRAAQRDAIKQARQNLKNLVYAAPLPASVAAGKYGWSAQSYLARRRMGNVWKAIVATPQVSAGKGSSMGEVMVDRSKAGFENYYYAVILNKGGMGGAYAPRPFWAQMVRVMRMRLREYGAIGLKAQKAWLLGDDTYGGTIYATGDVLPGSGSLAP